MAEVHTIEVADAIQSFSAAADDALKDGKERLAQEYLALLLSLDTKEARDAVENRLSGLNGVSNSALADEIVRSVERRVVRLWPKWLDPLANYASDDDRPPPSISSLAEHLWRDWAKDSESVATDDFRAAASSISKMAHAGFTLESDGVDQLVLGAIPPTTDSDLDELARLFSGVAILIGEGLATGELVGSSVTDSFSRWLSIATSPGQPYLDFLWKWVDWGLGLSTIQSLHAFGEAASSTSWLGSPWKETLVLKASKASRRAGGKDPVPYETKALASLVEAHGETASELVSEWVDGYAPAAEAFAEVVRGWGSSPGPKALTVLKSFCANGDPNDRWLGAYPAVDRTLEERPSSEFLEAVGFSETDVDQAVSVIQDLFARASNRDDREATLRLWHELRPTTDVHRRQLIEAVYIPTIRSGKQGVDLALRYLGLVVPPPRGTLTKIREAFESSARDDRQRRRAEGRLIEAGLLRRRGLFRRRVEEREPEETQRD